MLGGLVVRCALRRSLSLSLSSLSLSSSSLSLSSSSPSLLPSLSSSSSSSHFRYGSSAPNTSGVKLHSFTEGLFGGVVNEKLVFPYPDVLSEEDKENLPLIVESAEKFGIPFIFLSSLFCLILRELLYH